MNEKIWGDIGIFFKNPSKLKKNFPKRGFFIINPPPPPFPEALGSVKKLSIQSKELIY